jgi:hypothetical protein
MKEEEKRHQEWKRQLTKLARTRNCEESEHNSEYGVKEGMLK